MKKLLFIGIVVLMVQSLGAVTLPSTSYSPYSASSPSDDGYAIGGGTMVTASYSSLGAADDCSDDKHAQAAGYKGCADCCVSKYLDTTCYGKCMAQGGDPDSCAAECAGPEAKACTDACEGASLPLDGGLSILLILSVAGGAVKLLRNRDKE
ncbi:MAG: hypothetical protein MJ009_01515 [Paludibacteraceae bacterium]|nr:hypothetical protein [Paludibacteraceae bacterium]